MQTERVFREMPDFSENATMGLSNKARSHLVVYNANIGTILRPLVMEMIDVHGEAAQELIEKMKRHGNHVKVLHIGQEYAVSDPTSKNPRNAHPYIYRTHKHPDHI